MKSSKKSNTDVDDISRETQRLIKDSHVRLPYHKPKQKSLKDFLNRQKITAEFQVSITGSKKLLPKAWELIEKKEQNVEKFYNEDSVEENTLTSSCDDTQVEESVSLNDDKDEDEDDDIVNHDKGKCMLLELSDDEENVVNNSDEENLEENKCSTNYDDDENSNQSKSLEASETSSQQSNNEYLRNNLELNDLEDDSSDLKSSVANQFIDDEAESSELGDSSDEDDPPDFINDSGEEEDISTKKKRRIVLLSESSDEEDLNSEINLKADDLIPLTGELNKNMSTQQLMDMCSGQFQTQMAETQKDHSDQEFEDDFDSDVPLSGEINTDKNEDHKFTLSKDFKNDFEPDILQNDDEISRNEDELETLKLTSAKDFFDDEAELSESDWSSDDEDNLVQSIDTLEEEAGDKDKLDEDVVKDGLDKIYMRQLLDDDNQQVTALKEMLLEDGELHSDSGRKRKFQWDEIDDDGVFKKPLFSDNEDDADEALSDDEKSVLWRKERFKRESFLSQKNYSDDEDDENYFNQESNDSVAQPLVTVVKKTHIVKFEKDESIKITNTISVEKSNTTAKTIIPKADEITPINLNKFVRGSFMTQNNEKMTTALLYMNKKSSINSDSGCNEKNEVKSLTTIMSKAGSNPFAYLLRNDKPDTKNITSNDSINVFKKENLSQNKTSASIQPTEKFHQNKNKKSTTSILKHFE